MIEIWVCTFKQMGGQSERIIGYFSTETLAINAMQEFKSKLSLANFIYGYSIDKYDVDSIIIPESYFNCN